MAFALPAELQRAFERDGPLRAGVSDRAEQLVLAATRYSRAMGIRPDRPERVYAMLETVMRLKQLAAPRSTLNQESSNWKHWVAYCDYMGYDHVRPHASVLQLLGPMAIALESCFWAGALPFIIQRMNANWLQHPRRDRPNPPRASSALAVLRGVRRVHVRRLEIESVSLTTAVQVCHGMLKEYLLVHGKEALLPRRKEPFTRELIHKLLTLPDGTRLVGDSRVPAGAVEVRRDGMVWLNIFTLISVLSQCGFRKAEVTVADGEDFGLRNLSWADLQWRIHAVDPVGYITCPTPEQLDLLAPGDFALLRPPPSKSDQLGIHWGNDPIYLPWEAGELINGARWLADLERRRQIPFERRRHTPLFCDGSGMPFRHSPLDGILHAMLLALGLPESEAVKYSWHSFRVYLATALLAVKTPVPKIQALLRWKTAEACAIYARMDSADYAESLFAAVRADFDTIRTANLQTARNIAFGVDQLAARLNGGIDAMYADANACDAGADDDPGEAEF